jgi:hypothetical protein
MKPGEAGIRFVGGPWHNRIVPVKLVQNQTMLHVREFDSVHATCHTYHLYEFFTEHRTVYWQFIHGSIHCCPPPECLWTENLPNYLDDFTVRLFDGALRGLFFTLRGRHIDTCDDWQWPAGQP